MIFNFPSIPNVEICKFDLRFKSVMSFEKIAFLYLNLSQHNHSKLCISSVRKLKLNSAVGLMTFIPTLTDQIKSVQLVSSVYKSELILTKTPSVVFDDLLRPIPWRDQLLFQSL